jgi:taurine dioxygenase
MKRNESVERLAPKSVELTFANPWTRMARRLSPTALWNTRFYFSATKISRRINTRLSGKYFGDLHVHPVLPSRKEEGHPEIVILESSAKVPFVADRWHSDVTFESKPPLGSVLRGVIVPEHGGDTLWASATAAYEGLSDSMQRLMSNLEAVHDGSLFRAIADESQKGELAKDQTAKHPVIRTHPVSGKKTIYVNSTFTKSIVGMKPKESAAILNFLCEHVNSVEYTCRFHWKKNSLAIWDNRATQHSVVADNLNARRRVERVTICGDEPF